MPIPAKFEREIDATCPGCSETDTYTMPGTCSNCGQDYTVKLTKGHERPGGFFGALCPACGCSKVSCQPRSAFIG